MLVRAWIASVVTTVGLLVLGLLAESQQGRCYDGDPIPNCPDAHGFGELGYLFGALFWVGLAVCLPLTIACIYRARWSTSRRSSG